MSPLIVAEAPYKSLVISGSGGGRKRSEPVLRAVIKVVLPADHLEWDNNQTKFSLADVMGLTPDEQRKIQFRECVGASESKVYVKQNLNQDEDVGLDPDLVHTHSVKMVPKNSDFRKHLKDVVDDSSVSTSSSTKSSWTSSSLTSNVNVERTIMRVPNQPERTYGAYTVVITNHGNGIEGIRFMDNLPFFTRPLFHTLKVTLYVPPENSDNNNDDDPNAWQETASVSGEQAFDVLQLEVNASDFELTPTRLAFAVVF